MSSLPSKWLTDEGGDPIFPKFESTIPGGVTSWYTMRLTAIGEDQEEAFDLDVLSAHQEYEERDAVRCKKWARKFSHGAA